MCTALTLASHDGFHLFGRNMDLEYNFNQSVITVPRNFPLKNRLTNKIGRTPLGIMGMGTVMDNHPMLADGFNELGLACAGLNFPKYAHYQETSEKGAYNMAPYDMILWLLSSFATVDEVRREVGNVCLVGERFAPDVPLPTLHWIVTDAKGDCIVIESTKDGISAYDNPVGVLSNSPEFPWHLTNLNQYAGLVSASPADTQWGTHNLSPDGQGGGLHGLPGDSYPASRFVRAAFMRNHAVGLETGAGALATFFHILNNLAMAPGTVHTAQGMADITQYSSAMCLEERVYYYRTHNNFQINAVHMRDENLTAETLIVFPYSDTPAIHHQN